MTRDILDSLLAICGRRRSEIARLRVDDLEQQAALPAAPSTPPGPTLPGPALRLRRTKTSSAEARESVLVVGRPVDALRARLEFSKIEGGPAFRLINKWGQIGATALDPQGVNVIIESRCAAGLDPVQYSASGLRSGYLTQAPREGVSLPEAAQQASRYYNGGTDRTGQGGAISLLTHMA
jgi:hypothetical protein